MRILNANFLYAVPLAAAPLAAHAQDPLPEREAEHEQARGLLLEETFDEGTTLASWTEVVGASTGAGPASVIRFDDGALCLSGTRETTRWLALQRSIALKDVSWVRVSARMRTADVDRASARYANCNLYIRLGNAGLEATTVFDGTQEWTSVARRLEVPKGVEQLTIGCFLSMPGSAWFDDVRIEAVGEPEWSETTHGHYIYHVLPGDRISPEALKYNDESFEIASRFLGVESVEPVRFFKYPDRATKVELTGDSGNAFARPELRELHSLWESDRHEIVHVLAHSLGNPPALLAEGLAVFLSGSWQRRPVAEYASDVARDGRWIALSDLLDTASFRRFPDLITYAEAGALVEWLVLQFGREAFLKLYRALDSSQSMAANQRALEQALSVSLTELEQGLRDSLTR